MRITRHVAGKVERRVDTMLVEHLKIARFRGASTGRDEAVMTNSAHPCDDRRHNKRFPDEPMTSLRIFRGGRLTMQGGLEAATYRRHKPA
jgi:hypothetical protein